MSPSDKCFIKALYIVSDFLLKRKYFSKIHRNRRAAGVNALRQWSIIRGPWVGGSVTKLPTNILRYAETGSAQPPCCSIPSKKQIDTGAKLFYNEKNKIAGELV